MTETDRAVVAGWRKAARHPGTLLGALVVMLLPFALQGLHFDDTDTFYHLAGGRWMLEHGRVLDHETFSFSIPGRPWTNYYWLFQLVLATAERAGGLHGVIAVRAVFVLVTCVLVAVLLWRVTGGRRLATAALTLLASALYLSRALNVRPHLVSHLLLVLLLMRLRRFAASGSRFDPWIPAIFLFWANGHGVEYPVGLAALALHALAAVWTEGWRSLRRWAPLVAASVFALLINPFGARLLVTPAIGAEPEMMSILDEMRPISARSLFDPLPAFDLTAQGWLNIALLAGLALLPRWWRRRDLTAIGLYGLGLFLALEKLRFRPEAGLLVVPLLAAEVPHLPKGGARAARRVLAMLAVGLVAAYCVTAADHRRRGFFSLLDLARYPVAACRTIAEQRLSGNLFGDPGLGGYVTWCAPSVRVFMDFRSPEPFDGSLHWLTQAAGAQVPLGEVHARWPLDLLLFRAGSVQAERILSGAEPGFVPVSVDAGFLLFARASSAPEPIPFPRGNDDPRPSGDELRMQSQRLLRTWHLNAFAHETLARLDLAEGRPAEALQRVQPLRRSYPRDATWPWIEGLALVSLGRLAGAETALEEALRLSPQSARVVLDLTRVRLRRGRAAAGLRLLEDEARRRGFRLSAQEYALLGALREAAGRPRQAVDAYRRALWLDGSDPDFDVTAVRSALARLERHGSAGSLPAPPVVSPSPR